MDAAGAPNTQYDVAVVGGGPAGLSAALILGRCRRSVALVDDGHCRNAPARAAHGLLWGEGRSPGALLGSARDKLAPYDVEMHETTANRVRRDERGFAVELASGGWIACRKVILATGIIDALPTIDGLEELWGRSVFHCPYCHGWETRDLPIGIYGSGAEGYHLVGLMRGWSHDLVLFTDGPAELTPNQRTHLDDIGVAVREEHIGRLDARDGQLTAIVLGTGEVVPRRALYIRPEPRPRTNLVEDLGCDTDESGWPEARLSGATSVPGLFVAGDINTKPQMLSAAAASGVQAAVAVNEEFLKESFSAERLEAATGAEKPAA